MKNAMPFAARYATTVRSKFPFEWGMGMTPKVVAVALPLFAGAHVRHAKLFGDEWAASLGMMMHVMAMACIIVLALLLVATARGLAERTIWLLYIVSAAAIELRLGYAIHRDVMGLLLAIYLATCAGVLITNGISERWRKA